MNTDLSIINPRAHHPSVQAQLLAINAIDEQWFVEHPKVTAMVRAPFEVEQSIAALDGKRSFRVELTKCPNGRFIKKSCTDGIRHKGAPKQLKPKLAKRSKPKGFGK